MDKEQRLEKFLMELKERTLGRPIEKINLLRGDL